MRNFRLPLVLVVLYAATAFVDRCYAADHLAFLPQQTTATASVNVQIGFTVVALDASNNVDNGATGPLTISSTDGSSAS